LIRLKRIYDAPEKTDGERYLVDRLWPRGVTRQAARLTDWIREIGPSDELRKWFGHDPERWDEFKKRYMLELAAEQKQTYLDFLAARAAEKTVTLLFGSKDVERNNAVALKEALEERAKRDSSENAG